MDFTVSLLVSAEADIKLSNLRREATRGEVQRAQRAVISGLKIWPVSPHKLNHLALICLLTGKVCIEIPGL